MIAFIVMVAVYFIVRLMNQSTETESTTIKTFTWLGILVILICTIIMISNILEIQADLEQITRSLVEYRQ